MDISIGELREKVQRMEDVSFTAGTGATVRMDMSLLRSMSEAERSAARARFDALCAQLRVKYARAE